MVRRGRLLEELSGTDARFICLSAPSGYGKTSFLAQWAAQDPRPHIVVRVDPSRADPMGVARGVLEAMTAGGLLAEAVDLPEAAGALAWHQGVLPVLGGALAQVPTDVVIGIDGVSATGGPEWNSLLDTICSALPEGSAFVLGTRSKPPACLRSRRNQGSLLEVGPARLALDALEGAELVSALGLDLPDDQVLQLLEATQGWPAAMYLSALAVRSGHGTASLPPATFGVLADFMRDQILDQLDPADADFIVRCSVLDELDGPTCEAVSGRPDALARLRALSATNRLLIQLDPSGQRFSMHPLLATFLTSELQARSSSEWHAVHAAASRVLEEAGDLNSAVHHAKLAADDERLGRLIWSHAGELLGSGRMAVVRRWLADLGSDRLGSTAGLALAAAQVAQLTGDMAMMRHYQVAAAAACRDSGVEDLRADLLVLSALVGADGLAQMRQDCTEYLRVAPIESPWRSVAHFLDGVGLVLQGDFATGIAEMLVGEQAALALQVPHVQAQCLAAASLALTLTGDERRGRALLGDLRALVARYPMDHSATAAPVHIVLAQGYLADGRTHEARASADKALRLTSLIVGMAPWYAVQGRALLSQLYVGLGQLDRAASLLEEAELLHGPSSQSPVLDALLDRARQGVDAAERVDVGPEPLSTAEIRVLQYLPTHLTFPEIAAELFVSRYTVKTQAMSAYRKLDVHSRGEAIEKARSLGILPDASPGLP